MLLQWTGGRRSLAAAILVVCTLLVYLLKPPSSWHPTSTIVPETAPHESTQQTETSSQSQPTQQSEQHQPTPQQYEPVPSQSDPQRCPVTKVSMLYGAHKFSQLEEALETHRRHGERWGCRLESLERDLTPRKLYSKHFFLLSTMLQELAKPEEERQKWLLWVDADSIVLNPALSPCVFLPPADLEHVYALVTADHNGLNDGIFYIRVHPSAVDLLTQIAAYPLAHPDEDLGWFGEQAAMARVIKAIEAQHKDSHDATGIAWVPRPWFNYYEFEHGFEGEPGSFMVHFAGLAETRLTHMQNWLDELQQNQAKWELPVENTSYRDSIAEFWKAYAADPAGNSQAAKPESHQ